MYLDYLQYQKFYNSSIGKIVSSTIKKKIKKYCFVYENQSIGCFGYVDPFVSFDLEKVNSSFYYSKRLGISKNKANKTLQVLIDEEKIPCQDSYFDHVVAIHHLENSFNVKNSLREIWRSLAPEGKAYIILPNKKSSWHLSSKSPFSTGFGYSKNQLSNLFEQSFFDVQFIDRLIYFPNFNNNLFLKNIFLIDKVSSIFFRYFNGVYLCVLKKRIFAHPENFDFAKNSLVKRVVKNF